jgi:hypothetical protein
MPFVDPLDSTKTNGIVFFPGTMVGSWWLARSRSTRSGSARWRWRG